FDADEVRRFLRTTERIPGSKVRYAGGEAVADSLIRTVIQAPPPALAAAYRTYPYDIRAVTDDSPFFWHFTGFRQAVAGVLTAGKPLLDPSEGAGERVMLALLAC